MTFRVASTPGKKFVKSVDAPAATIFPVMYATDRV